MDNIRVNRSGESENSVAQEQLDKLVEQYKSTHKEEVVSETFDLLSDGESKYLTGWFHQFSWILKRAVSRVIRDPMILATELPSYIILAVLMVQFFYKKILNNV